MTIIYDMPNAEYHAHDSISKSGLDKLAISPAHYKYYKENGTKETAALVFGRAIHTMVLEPEKSADEVIVMPDEWLTKKECGISQEDQKEAFRHKHQHKAILNVDQMDTANGMLKAIEAHAAARYILRKNKGKAEVSVFWQDEETSVDCRARFDWLLDNDLICDLKSTGCAKPEIFDRSAFEYRYHVQAAFYMEGFRRAFGHEPAGFVFIAAEKEAPYPVCVFQATDDFIELGRREYRRDLLTYAECLRTGEYPAYPDVQLMPLNLPKYAQKILTEGE